MVPGTPGEEDTFKCFHGGDSLLFPTPTHTFSVVPPWTGPFPSLSLSAWQENAHHQSHSLQEAAGVIQRASSRQCLWLSLWTATFLPGEITRLWDNCLGLGSMNVFHQLSCPKQTLVGAPS